ncbi:UNVERIFIED_CONTAM: Zinc finger BED domain-containing protein RICESLEEPER 1 [Sesamum angustifolium]|uniref:Zinc finger BED domain-containing protein RICESLEEPER 1 n=1 Tax=Sesamum angustifolium TaxID=2727405 RepID=A0AAW2IKQ5_9LAMI
MLAAAIKFKTSSQGSDYPTSNLFLNEVSRVKVLLDKKALENIFIRDMVAKMKSKFDKYWGDSNLLMSIAAVLDPRCKLRALEFCFPRLYSSENVERQIVVVRKTLYELYSEYVAIFNIEDESIGEGQRNKLSNPNLRHVETQCGWSEYAEYLKHGSSVDVWRRLAAKTLWSKKKPWVFIQALARARARARRCERNNSSSSSKARARAGAHYISLELKLELNLYKLVELKLKLET